MSSIYNDAIDILSKKHYIVTRTNGRFLLSNGNKYHAHAFSVVLNTIRVLKNNKKFNNEVKQLQAKESFLIDQKIKSKGLFIDNKSFASNVPWVSLRYIVLTNYRTNEYAWYFANVHTSHSELERVYQIMNGREWDAHTGGFYTYDKDKSNLTLFGRSDTFGYNLEYVERALPTLEKILKERNTNLVIEEVNR